MEIKLDSLIPYEKIITDANSVFEIVEKNGKVVLLKDNQPVYVIAKIDASLDSIEKPADVKSSKYTLQEAMKIVLLEAEDNTMHAAALADDIFSRKLYLQKNGGKAQYNQIRARCGHYPDMFEALPRNMIKLKEEVGK
jgi:antitoxin Phd